jgi:NAD(P)-binding Rossmann-like domain
MSTHACGESRILAPGAGKSIVVVGGGLAGLTAAFEALTYGFRVTLYEREAELGGKLAGGIDDQHGFHEHSFRAVTPDSYFAFFDVFDRLGLDRSSLLTPLQATIRTDSGSIPYFDRDGHRVVVPGILKFALPRRRFAELWRLLRKMMQLTCLWTAGRPDDGISFGASMAIAGETTGTLSHHFLVSSARSALATDLMEVRLSSVAPFMLPELYPGRTYMFTSREDWRSTIIIPLVEALRDRFEDRLTVRLNHALNAVLPERRNPGRIASLAFSGNATTDRDVGPAGDEITDYYIFSLPRPVMVRLGILDPDHVAGEPEWTFCVDINLKRIPRNLAAAINRFVLPVDGPWSLIAALYVRPETAEASKGAVVFSATAAHALPPAVQGVLRVAVNDVKASGNRIGKPFLCCTPEEALAEIATQISGSAGSLDLDWEEDVFAVNWGPGVEYTSGTHQCYARQQEMEPHYSYGPFLENEQGWWRSNCTLDNQRYDEVFTTATSARFVNARVAGEAVLDRHDYGTYVATMETAVRSAKNAVQSILEAEGSDIKIFPFDRPLYGPLFKLARRLFGGRAKR